MDPDEIPMGERCRGALIAGTAMAGPPVDDAMLGEHGACLEIARGPAVDSLCPLCQTVRRNPGPQAKISSELEGVLMNMRDNGGPDLLAQARELLRNGEYSPVREPNV